MFRPRVLVTGLSGLIGRALRGRLESRYDLRALNRRPVDGLTCFQADIADLEAIRPAFDGVTTVVHLAGNPSAAAPAEATMRDNVVGTYNVFEAARRAGVRRIVFASSGAVVNGYEADEPYRSLVAGEYAGLASWPLLTHEAPLRPRNLYGVSKAWGEALARCYVEVHGLSMICVRIGHVTAEDRPVTVRDFTVWCSQADVGRLFELAIAAPESVRFAIVYAVSHNRWGFRDLEHARVTLGYEPRDSAEDHRR